MTNFCSPLFLALAESVSVKVVLYRRLPGCVVMGINRTRRLFGRQKKDAWAASQYTLYGFRPRCYHFLSPLFLFFSLWSRKLHFRYAHRYFLDIYDMLKQSKELYRRGFWLEKRCLKMTIGFTLLLHFFTFAEEVLRTSSSAEDPELTWIFFCFSYSWKKLETLINKFNYLPQVRKPDVLHLSVGKKKKTDGSTGDHSIDLNPGLSLLHLVAAFLIWFSMMISCHESFFHIFVTAVKCSLPFLELRFIFSNFHVHFLFGHEKKKKKNAWDLHGHPSRFTFKNKIITSLK